MQTTDQPVNRRRAAVTTFASSTAITLLVSIQALVLMPMYLTHIGPRMYGAWLATGDLLVLMLAFDMGIPNILIQRIGAALAASDKRAIGVYFGTGATILILFSLALGIALWAISPFVPTWVHLHGAEAELLQKTFLLDAVALCMMLINFVFQGLARGLQQTTMVNLSSLMATLVGFSITLALLLSGYGLWSISIGVAVRGLMTLIGSLLFLFFGVDKEIRQSSRFDKEVAQDLWKNCPSLFAAGLGYGFMSNCQILLAALVLGPESAVIFGLTRKGADVARSVLDSVGNASYGGFAHLFATGDKARGRHVYRDHCCLFGGRRGPHVCLHRRQSESCRSMGQCQDVRRQHPNHPHRNFNSHRWLVLLIAFTLSFDKSTQCGFHSPTSRVRLSATRHAGLPVSIRFTGTASWCYRYWPRQRTLE